LWYLFHHLCVCVSENKVTINHVNPQIYHKFLYFLMFKNWRILLGSFFFIFPCWFSRDDRIMIIPCWSSLWKKKHYRWLIYSNSGIIPQ
jgi:hypothetical protein